MSRRSQSRSRSKSNSKDAESLKLADPKIVKLLYQMMYDVHQIFGNNKIKYWVDGGTFLGAVRHGGIIPWDDDLDIAMLKTDLKNFLALQDNFTNCGYSTAKTWFGYKIFYSDRKPPKGSDYSFPNLDIFLYNNANPENKYEYTYKQARDTWPKGYWEHDETFPLKLYNFGTFKVYGAKDFKHYFDRLYGKDWNKIAYREYDHESEEFVTEKKIKVKLTPSMRKPAQPMDVKERDCVKHCITKTSAEKLKKFDAEAWEQEETETCKNESKCSKNFNVKMPVYVINCKMHVDRFAKFTKHADKAGLSACRVPCVLGKKFSEDEICKLIESGIVSKKADMTQVEMSINMSHYNCWQRLINSCMDYALILEDDIEVKPDFIKRINEIMEELKENDLDNFSILHLWNGNWQQTKSKHKSMLSISDKIKIVKETVEYNAGAASYIISAKYAKYLMNHFFPIKMPQDILIGSFVNKGNHLSLKMTHDKKQQCYLSPLLDMPCGGEGGTGAQTTQTYNAPTVKTYNCESCPSPKRSRSRK